MALFAPLHETTHRTPFRGAWLNRVVGWACGFVLVLPPEWFRLFHMAHHRHTQDPAHDPELAGAAPLTRRGYAWRLTGLPYWIAEWRLLCATALGRAEAPFIPAGRRAAVVAEARVYLAAYAVLAAGSVALGTAWLWWLYVGPALLGQPFLRALLLAEHGGLPRVADALRNTRTTMSGRAVAWLYWNANFHAEHHLAPGVPFHRLPRLHAVVRPRLRALSPSYAAAHADIRAAL
jgi:fatty acid desaturase